MPSVRTNDQLVDHIGGPRRVASYALQHAIWKSQNNRDAYLLEKQLMQ